MRYGELPLGAASRVDTLTTVAAVDTRNILGEVTTTRTTPTFTV